MNLRDAIEDLKNFVRLKTTQQPAFLDMIINEIEPRVPKKPVKGRFRGLGKYYCCPRCGVKETADGVITETELYSAYEFCPHCGQAIDWSDGQI